MGSDTDRTSSRPRSRSNDDAERMPVLTTRSADAQQSYPLRDRTHERLLPKNPMF